MSLSGQDIMPPNLVDFNPDPPPAVGKRTLITSTDWTRWGFYSVDPGFPPSLLTSAKYNVSFNSYLTLWASAAGQEAGGQGTPGAVASQR